VPTHTNVSEDGISDVTHSHVTNTLNIDHHIFTRSKFGRTGNAHRGKAGETGRRNGPIGFIDSFFPSFFLEAITSTSKSERPRSVISLTIAARGSLVKCQTPRRFDNNDGFHDLASPACTRARSSQIFILIEAAASLDHRSTATFAFFVFLPFRYEL